MPAWRRPASMSRPPRRTCSSSRDNAKRQRDLWAQGLTTKELLDRAESELKVRETELQARETDDLRRANQMIRQESAQLSTSQYQPPASDAAGAV